MKKTTSIINKSIIELATLKPFPKGLRRSWRNTNYLNDLDLMDKYNLTTPQSIPRLKEIRFEWGSHEIVESYNKSGVNVDLSMAVKFYLIAYLFNSYTPFVRNSRMKVNESDKAPFNLIVTLTDRELMDSFLKRLYIDNWNFLTKEEVYTHEETKHSRVTVSSKIPIQAFIEPEMFKNFPTGKKTSVYIVV